MVTYMERGVRLGIALIYPHVTSASSDVILVGADTVDIPLSARAPRLPNRDSAADSATQNEPWTYYWIALQSEVCRIAVLQI